MKYGGKAAQTVAVAPFSPEEFEMIQRLIRTLVGAAVVAAFAGNVAAQDSKVADELAKYREALRIPSSIQRRRLMKAG